jgi:hypothetical protein
VTAEQFEREKLYQSALAVAQTMLRMGIIIEDEFTIIDTILLRKYRPLLGSLYAVKTSDSLDFTGFTSDV